MSDGENNPFSIESKKIHNSPKRNRYPNVWSSSEQEEKLSGYLEIQPEFWPTVKFGTHVRYITKNNDFNVGGFVLKNPFVYKGDTTEIKPSIDIGIYPEYGDKIGIKLQNTFSKSASNYSVWVVAYEDIMKLYVKVDASIRTIVQSLETTIESVNNNMKKITDYIKRMEDRLAKLEAKK